MDVLRFPIHDSLDLYGARRGLVALGTRLKFSSSDCQELAIVVSELISNILKYGVRGGVAYEPVNDEGYGTGIRVTAHDVGPPFYDLQLALRDGFNDRGPIDPVTLFNRGGFGTGMGAIVRLTDSFEVRAVPGGKEICVVRYRARPRTKRRPAS